MFLPPLSMSIDLLTLAYSRARKGFGGKLPSALANKDENTRTRHNKSVSVVIPIFNEAEKIGSTVDCIFRQTYPVKDIYLLDDLSTDASKEVCRQLERKHEKVSHVRREQKLGKAGNINALVAERADELGEFVLVVDGDVRLHTTCVEELVKATDNAAVVTGFGYTTKPTSYIAKMLYEGMSWINAVFSFRKRAQVFRNAVFVICGALSLYRKEVLKEIPIPERTITEDTDYTWLLQEKGYKINYNKSAQAVGRNPDSLKGFWKRHERWFCGTFQCLYVHGFRELGKSRKLLYSTIVPGCLEVIPYSVIISSLPVLALFYPSLAVGVLIADLLLSVPFLFFHRQGFWHAVNHLPDIYAYKYFGGVACLYSGVKTTIERISGQTNRWSNNWENSSRAYIRPKRLTKRRMRKVLESCLYLEKEWTALGEDPWTNENFMLPKRKKWALSSYVSLNGRVIGYTILSETGKGEAYLHKILVDSDYHGLGIGSALFNDARERCKKHNIQRLFFKVRVTNEAANALYRKHNVVYSGKEMSPDGVERYLCELRPCEPEENLKILKTSA